MKSAILLASVMLLGSQAVNAADNAWANRPYEANYTYNSQQGNGTYRMVSDGKGHSLIQTDINNMGSTMIVDRVNKTCYSITSLPGGQKMAMKTPYKEQDTASSTAESMKKMGAKELGAKVVEGHPCHGWKYTVSGTTTETWVGDDIDFMVKSVSTIPNAGTTTMTLKNYSKTVPAGVSFSVPAGIKVTDMSK